jgi:Flp pilus assembly protein TadG
MNVAPDLQERRDRGAITVIMVMLIVIVFAGAALIVDGGRVMVARRHASNTAEAAARAAVATATPVSGFDPVKARAAAYDYTDRAGVAAADVVVEVAADHVSVTVTERRRTVFLVLGGQESSVRATGTARLVSG